MLLIQGGYIVDPEEKCGGIGDILIKDGKIQKIAPTIDKASVETGEEGLEIIRAEGKLVAPGMVDVHVHFREPGFTHKEDILTGGATAAKGGFTSIVLMANTRPSVDNEETLKEILEKGRQTGIHIHTCANVTKGMKGQELTDMEGLAKAGAAGFTDDGMPLLDENIVKKAMAEAARLGKPLSFHEENPAYIQNNGIHAGKASDFYQIGGSDRMAEIDMVRRDVALAEGTGADIVIQHISTKEAVELVRQARKANAHIHAEAAPHHFTLTQEAVIRYGTLAKMNPPLREEADRVAILEGLKDGTIDMIATDHAPHTKEEKERPFTEAPSGIIGLETALSLAIRELVNPGLLTMEQLFCRMAWQPARLYKLETGYLAEGGPADLVIFDPEEQWRVEGFCSKSSNSPFLGEVLPGTVYYTICNGSIVYKKEGE
ncbi:MAG: dihydroorotase [Lachnospiraceae bacterium]|nr:dihydroorotase [Lachnospiraceae bacterium]